MTETASNQFVEHALGLRWSAIDSVARAAAKALLLDTLCVGVAGAAAKNADAVLAVARTWGEGGTCSVLGHQDHRLPAPSAAFINAFQIHCQEFDCVHEPAVLHPLSTVAAVLRAESERSGPYDGETFLSALVAGVDIAVALGLASTTPLKFFRPATAGIFGSVAALARLRGLDHSVALDALGHALAFASGTMQAHLEGKPTLPVQVANAARGAFVAVDLAAAGLPSSQHPIEGPFGYLSLFETGFDLGPVLRDLSAVRRISEVSFKPFPTGRAAHGGLVATGLLMRDHEVTADRLESLEFRAPPLIKRLVGRRPGPGMDVAYARLCLPWLTAVALRQGGVGLADFEAERIGDPVVLALASRISVVEDNSTDPAAFLPLDAIATTKDGRRVAVRIDRMLGSPLDPLTREQQREKARRCLTHAGFGGALERLIDVVDHLERETNVGLALRF